MAVIEQLVRIATNRSGAVDDTVTRLQSTDTSMAVNIAEQHIPDLPASIITSGMISGDRINIGNGLTVEGGSIVANPVNLTDVRTFADPEARNSEVGVEWHVGDVAIVTSGGDITEGGSTPVGTAYSVLSVPTSTQFVVAGGFDRINNVFQADLPNVGDIVRFDEGGGNFSGSTSGGTDFLITARERTNPGNDQVTFTVDRDLTAVVPAVNGAEQVFSGAGGTTTNVASGSYVYTGTDQTGNPGATTNADWIQLEAPGGTAGEAQLARFTLTDADGNVQEPVLLNTLTFNAATGSFNVNGNAISTGSGNNTNSVEGFYIDDRPIVAADIDPANPTAGIVLDIVAGTLALTKSIFDAVGSNGVTLPTAFTQSVMVYVNGLKLITSDVTVDNTQPGGALDRITFAITRDEINMILDGSGAFVVEVVQPVSVVS